VIEKRLPVNPADNKQPLLLLVQGGSSELKVPLPSFREMTERLASDPAGQAIVFELLIRTFFVCVLGIREECVGWRRGESKATRRTWCTDGVAHQQMASTIFGWVQAAFGPIEAQGRGSLHPHILLWLLDVSVEEAVELLSRDPDTFKVNLQKWMTQVLAAVAATQETSVTELGWMWDGDPRMHEHCAPLPFGPHEKERYRADGGAERTTEADVEKGSAWQADDKLYFSVPGATAAEDEWPEAVRPNLVLRTTDGQEVDAPTWKQAFEDAQKGIWSQPISDTAPGKRPEFCTQREFLSAHELDQTAVEELRAALPSDAFLSEIARDARELVIGCAVHVCSPSCWKHHSSGKRMQICRHGFYHVVVFVTEDGHAVKRRRQGKQMRCCMAICRDTRYGMAGRIITFQTHPWECPTNYAALVAMRCNIDVQDMRRVPPPAVWMRPEDLEPPARPDEEEACHGAYPQRALDFSLGPRSQWGWMQHLGAAKDARNVVTPDTDWHAVFQRLCGMPEAAWEQLDSDDEVSATMKACLRAGRDIFIDAHNTGFYINSYTTKVNPTMDNVLQRIMQGIRRLHTEWEEKAATEKTLQTELPRDGEDKTTADSADEKTSRQQAFRRALQTLNRLDTSFRRASWKSGCEMLFPILFGHMSFQTHRCWCIFMRRTIWLAAESWRRYYGQAKNTVVGSNSVAPQFKLPTGALITLPQGWRTELREGQEVYIDPDGASYTSQELLPLALAAFEEESHIQGSQWGCESRA